MAAKYPSAIPGVEPLRQGKTRDIFRVEAKSGRDKGIPGFLIVATDRLSTHNVVHTSIVPYKGMVLNALNVFWLDKILPEAGIMTHLMAYGEDIYSYLPERRGFYPHDLHERSIVVRQYGVIPIEFIFRARMGGSFYKDYYSKGLPNPYGVELPPGLPLMSEFPEPIFTPTDKSDDDEPRNAAEVMTSYPGACNLAREVFKLTHDYLLHSCGIEMIDSKFEIGFTRGANYPVVIDEVATPDSSRFCLPKSIVLGKDPPWLDKQIARDAAEAQWAGGKKVPLEFNELIVDRLSETYLALFKAVTQRDLYQFINEEY